MTGTIFDILSDEKEEPKKGKEGFVELAENAPIPKQKSFLNDIADYSKTALKGLAEGAVRLGKMVGPIQGEQTREQEQQDLEESLNKLLPTEEGFGQKSLRRGLREAPTALAFPGSKLATLPRAIAAGFAGEGAKELGAPEWAQTAAELTAYIGPDVTKKLLEKSKNKEIIEFGKKMGLTDEQITPLIQSEFKQKWLTKLAPKKGQTQEALSSTKKALDATYSSIESSPIAAKTISQPEKTTLIKEINQRLSSMPFEVREKIAPDLKDLLSTDVTGKSLMNFWKDINYHVGTNSQLGILKDPVKKAISSISPEFAKDFQMTNSLYSKYYPIASKLKPSLASDIVSAAETITLLGGTGLGLMTGNFSTLFAVLGEQGVKKIAQQMLINPRFQQLAEKSVQAINQNKFAGVKKLYDQYKVEVSKISPESGKRLPEISEDEFKELSHQKQKPEDRQ